MISVFMMMTFKIVLDILQLWMLVLINNDFNQAFIQNVDDVENQDIMWLPVMGTLKEHRFCYDKGENKFHTTD